MNGESKRDDELLCGQFLREHGLSISELKIDYFERHKRSRVYDGPWNPGITLGDSMQEISTRESYIEQFGFALLSFGAIEAIRPYQPLVELGAGSGYWAYELKRFGIDVVATDKGVQMFRNFRSGKLERWKKTYTEIEELNSVEAIRKYPNRVPLIVWPSYGEAWAADALNIYMGNTVIYFGEGYGNATADDRFHEILEQRFANQTFVRMPHFWGCYDRWLVIANKPKQLNLKTERKSENDELSILQRPSQDQVGPGHAPEKTPRKVEGKRQ
jgi:hypothetical protein